MYIWRGKSRRDRREFLLGGVSLWGAPKGSENKIAEDEKLRLNLEEKHVETFKQRTRVTIFKYLNTKQGKDEIDHLVAEIERLNIEHARELRKASGEVDVDSEGNPIEIEVVPEEMKKKANIYEIFRKFDEDGSDSIDRNELRVLLNELKVPMTDDELAVLINELDTDGEGEIEFEEFYMWFVREAEAQKSKKRLVGIKQYIVGTAQRIGIFQAKEGEDNIYKGFKRMVLEVEARNLIIDSTVFDTVTAVRKEFRIAHPPLFLCDRLDCGESFQTNKELLEHHRDVAYHKVKERERLELSKKFTPVRNVLEGSHGRQILANRLLFNGELGAFEGRVLAASLTPFRPHMSDPEGKREQQLRDGILVMGADPIHGIRPQHRTKGISKQYRAPGSSKPGTDQLKDVVIELLHCRDHKIDVYVSPSTSTHVEIMFQWRGFAVGSIYLIGEFNGWKPEELFPHPKAPLNKNVLFKKLSPGKYRYRFIIDGKEVHDPEASVEEPPPDAPENHVLSNILLVINPISKVSTSSRALKSPDLFSSNNLSHINLRNACVLDDGAWALSSYMSKNSFVKILDLSYNAISDEGMQAIAVGLINFTGLESLKLNGNGFGFDGCRYLLKTLSSSTCIRSLELSANNIGDDGAEILGELLHHHQSVEELFLDSCLIGNYGIEKLGEAIESNRSLLKLNLSNNRFTYSGIDRFMLYLRLNGKLQSIDLSNNNLGADGVRSVGEMLLYNDSLRVLNVSRTNMMSGRSAMGIHAIGAALRTKNKALNELYLNFNNLRDEIVLEFAYALYFNRGLLVCDLKGNHISEEWFKPNHYMLTKLLKDMPSIQTSLDRNKELRQDPILFEKYTVKPRPMEAEVEGRWTVRRRWRKLSKKGEKERLEKLANQEEQERIDAEDEYVSFHLKESMNSLDKFLLGQEGVVFLKCLAKVITQYINSLAGGKEAELEDKLLKAAAASEAASSMIKDLSITITANEPKKVLSNIVARKEEAARLEQQARSEALAKAALQEALENTEAVTKQHEELSNNWVSKSHLAIIAILFLQNECDENYFLPPGKIDQIFVNLCLPLRETDILAAIDGSIIPVKNMIGLKKFTKYLKTNSYQLSKSNTFMRYRVMADLVLKSPLDEAKELISHFTKIEEQRRLMLEYRSIPNKMPKFLCEFCGMRFVNGKSLERHMRKLSQHQRYLQKQDVIESIQFVLRRAKYFMTGTYFPCYYELVHSSKLPTNHLPQIFDSRGIEGRPIGVIEPERTVRVEDSLGYWMKIRFENRFGWVLYRNRFSEILIPACRSISRAFWNKMDVWERPKYYKLCDTLSDQTEIKVRFKPLLDAEVCGYLIKGTVIECGGILKEWIQIKYENHACVWALHLQPQTDQKLMEPLHPALQNKLQFIVTSSPCVLTESQLSLSEYDLLATLGEEAQVSTWGEEDEIIAAQSSSAIS